MNENQIIGAETNDIAAQTDGVAESVAEQPKLYTEAEFNAKLDEVLSKKIARKEAKIRKEYDRRYGELEGVLKAGMGKEDVGEITSDLREFYGGKKGIKLPEKPNYTAQDIEVLAKADAADIINSGYEEVVEEVERLAAIGAANMTAREKAAFKVLAEHRQAAERAQELSKLGITEDVYNSPEFKAFAGKFNSDTPIADVYNIYKQTQPKKDIKPMGSMKHESPTDSSLKEFYSYEEAAKFTNADYDRNPGLEERVKASMSRWK